MLRKGNLLKKRKNKSKTKLQTFQQKYPRKRVFPKKKQARRGPRNHESDALVLGLSPESGGWRMDAAKV